MNVSCSAPIVMPRAPAARLHVTEILSEMSIAFAPQPNWIAVAGIRHHINKVERSGAGKQSIPPVRNLGARGHPLKFPLRVHCLVTTEACIAVSSHLVLALGTVTFPWYASSTWEVPWHRQRSVSDASFRLCPNHLKLHASLMQSV